MSISLSHSIQKCAMLAAFVAFGLKLAFHVDIPDPIIGVLFIVAGLLILFVFNGQVSES